MVRNPRQIFGYPNAILGALSTRLVETHVTNRETQVVAWRKQIEVLNDATADLPPDCRLLLEYPLLHLGRRIDAVLNTYRVLPTRARYAMVIWVPEGDVMDNTRDPATFDSIGEFLAECGTQPLKEGPEKEPMLISQTGLLI